jgi:putative ABC transport system permease protein
MRFSDFIFVGLKNLWRRRLRSFLTIVAVLIGSTAVVALLILAFGAKSVFIGQLEATGMLNRITIIGDKDADINFFGGGEVESEDATKLTDHIVDNIKLMDNVIAVTPIVGAHSFQSLQIKGIGNEKKLRPNISGIRPDPEFDLTLSAGRNLMDNEEDKGKVVLANRYIEALDIDNPEDVIGKTVTFGTWEGYRNIDMPLLPQDAPEEEWKKVQEIEATIIGVTASGPGDGDSYITEAWAKRLRTQHYYGPSTDEEMARVEKLNTQLGEEVGRTGREIRDDEWYRPEPTIEINDEIKENGFDMIYAQIDNAQLVEGIAASIEEEFDVGAITAKEFLDQFLSIFTVITIVLTAIGGIALLVAAVGIINTMVMSVMERTKEIGIMKAVGASKRNIRLMFTFEAGLLGFWGGVAGIGLGYGLTLIANYFVNQALSGDGLAAQNVAQLEWWLALSVVGFTTIIGMIAGLYPASRAAKLDPVDALRRE